MTGASPLSMRMMKSPSRTRDELVQRVHHLQQVVGDDVVGMILERLLERRPSARLVAGAQQVRAEIGEARGLCGSSASPLRTSTTASSKR